MNSEVSSTRLRRGFLTARESLQNPAETIACQDIPRYHPGTSYPRQGQAGIALAVLAHLHDDGSRGR